MRNSLGDNVILTIFGESHGPLVGGTLDNLPPGLKVDEERIKKALSKRRPNGVNSTARVEKDNFQIVSGVFNGFTTGDPLTILIPNENTHSQDYPLGLVRPGHCDFVMHEVSGGYNDYRGGGHTSGRITAAIVALGEIAKMALENKGVAIASHALCIGGAFDRSFSNLEDDIETLKEKEFPALLDSARDEMQQKIEDAKRQSNSVGGVTETAIVGLPLGLGDPWFASLEGVLSNAMFALGGVKGIEFGDGFAFAALQGDRANDPMVYKGDKATFLSNHNGGVNGGISNGMPVIFRLAVKPISSIGIKQRSINFENKENVELQLKGRHDPCIVHRICPAIDGLASIVIMDEIVKTFGKGYFNNK